MPQYFHAVVAIDHAEATVFAFARNDVTEHRIKTADRQGHIHHKAGLSGHAHDGKAYLAAVAGALKPFREILIVGHGTAKEELAGFIRDHAPLLAPRILGVEAIDRPSRGEILAFARQFFARKDLMTPQL